MALTRILRQASRRQEAVDPRVDWEEVARVAYELYEQRGRVDGYDIEDWARAEEIVRERQRAA